MSKELRSPLSKARGNGSAHEGAHHWIMQRITAVASLVLISWFVVSIICLINQPHEAAGKFFESPLNAVLMSLLIIASFYHSMIGLQVVFEDYISSKGKRIVAVLVVKLGLLALGAASILAIIKMHLG